MTDAELSAQARKAAPLYGNDWGVLLVQLADALDRHNAPGKLTEGEIRQSSSQSRDVGFGEFYDEINPTTERHSAPLPEAVAGLVSVIEEFLDDADHFELVDGSAVDITPADNALGGLTSLIASQAREIERLKADNDEMDTRFREICDRGNNNRVRADKAEQRAEAAEARARHSAPNPFTGPFPAIWDDRGNLLEGILRGPEAKIKDQVKAFLKERGAWFFMPVFTGYGTPTLDFIGCYKGRFFAIETKAPGKKPTPRQNVTMNTITLSGGACFWDDDVDRLLFSLQSWFG